MNAPFGSPIVRGAWGNNSRGRAGTPKASKSSRGGQRGSPKGTPLKELSKIVSGWLPEAFGGGPKPEKAYAAVGGRAAPGTSPRTSVQIRLQKFPAEYMADVSEGRQRNGGRGGGWRRRWQWGGG